MNYSNLHAYNSAQPNGWIAARCGLCVVMVSTCEFATKISMSAENMLAFASWTHNYADNLSKFSVRIWCECSVARKLCQHWQISWSAWFYRPSIKFAYSHLVAIGTIFNCSKIHWIWCRCRTDVSRHVRIETENLDLLLCSVKRTRFLTHFHSCRKDGAVVQDLIIGNPSKTAAHLSVHRKNELVFENPHKMLYGSKETGKRPWMWEFRARGFGFQFFSLSADKKGKKLDSNLVSHHIQLILNSRDISILWIIY